jgi:SNF2 family DNA or RNA helicase
MEDLGVAEDLTVSRHGKLLGLAFQRIILDEAHTIRSLTFFLN